MIHGRKDTSTGEQRELERGSVQLPDLHGLVNDHCGEMQGRCIGGGRRMARGNREVFSAAGTVYRIGVTVAAGPGNGKRPARNQIAHRAAPAVLRDIHPLGLRDRQQVASHSGKADGLSGRAAAFARGQMFQIKVVHAQDESRDNHKTDQSAHDRIIVALRRSERNGPLREVV